MSETPQDEEKRKEALKKMFALKKIEIKFLTKKSAADLVSEGRERV